MAAVARLELLKRFLEGGRHRGVSGVRAVPGLRVERLPVRRVGQADGMERRDVRKRVVVKKHDLCGGREIKSKA